jgi:beta-glucanase (GH16 family)
MPFDYTGWTRSFSEDFDGFSWQPVSSSKVYLRTHDGNNWLTRFPSGARTLGSNNELQYYMDPYHAGSSGRPLGVDPFSISNGILSVAADHTSPEIAPYINNYRYTSGIINTYDSFAQAHGYFEMRAQLPAGRGLWPAFWLLPQDRSWPPEIDIMEVLGQEPNRLHMSVHSQQTGTYALRTFSASVGDLSDGFHTYGVAWSSLEIIWYLDGQELARAVTSADLQDRPMYLLANLAVGGWAGEPDPATKQDRLHPRLHRGGRGGGAHAA